MQSSNIFTYIVFCFVANSHSIHSHNVWHWKISLTHKCLRYPRKTTITKPICMKTSPIQSITMLNVSMSRWYITRKSSKSSIILIARTSHIIFIINNHHNFWHFIALYFFETKQFEKNTPDRNKSQELNGLWRGCKRTLYNLKGEERTISTLARMTTVERNVKP